VFGVDAEDVPRLRKERKNFKTDPRFDAIMADIEGGMFGDKDYFKPLVDSVSNMKVRGGGGDCCAQVRGAGRRAGSNPAASRPRTPGLALACLPSSAPLDTPPTHLPTHPPTQRSATTGSWWPTILPTTCAPRRRSTRCAPRPAPLPAPPPGRAPFSLRPGARPARAPG
jgi:hypothetical protein